MPDRRTRLAGTFARYAEEARGRAAAILGLLDTPEIALRGVVLHAHTLAGSGATMGEAEISSAARSLEHLADDLMTAGRQPDAEERQKMVELAERLSTLTTEFDPDAMLDGFIARVFPGH